PIGKENMEFLKKMETCNSISVHIRRGDYLKTDLIHIYGGICTSKYYREAIKFMEQEVEEPFFFFFSDDCLYVETEFADIRNKIIISHNRDDRSFFDMYLMAHAKNMILANSTFSCWAAYLNRTAKIIITPDRWVNTDFSKLEALPNEWIKIRV
ncbi:alpha-1,2-fucosyltransferase, partial [Phocaeicola vulgatus]